MSFNWIPTNIKNLSVIYIFRLTSSLVYYGVSYGSVDLGWNRYLMFALTSIIEFPSNMFTIWLLNRYLYAVVKVVVINLSHCIDLCMPVCVLANSWRSTKKTEKELPQSLWHISEHNCHKHPIEQLLLLSLLFLLLLLLLLLLFYVFTSVCMSICLSVYRISQNVLDGRKFKNIFWLAGHRPRTKPLNFGWMWLKFMIKIS